MIVKVFAIHDLKAGFFQVPFFLPSVGQAVRACMDLAADPGSMLSRHPADFALYQIAVYDDATAVFTPCQPYEHIGSGVAFLPAETKQGGLI